MQKRKADLEKINSLIERFSKIQRIRQESLNILLKTDKKAGEYKLDRLKKRLEDLTK